MGHVYVKAILSNPFVDGLVAEAEALVDTGATFSVVPRSLAESLQLPITGRRRVRTATGEIEVDRGTALIQLNGQRELSPVLISDTVEKVLIGVMTLEALALSVDPTTGELNEAELLLY